MKSLYIITVLILVLLAIAIFVNKYSDYQYQVQKIDMLEIKNQKRKDKLKYYRSISEPCHIMGLKNPRSCYFGSKYKCSWCEKAERCNKIN